MRKIKKTPYTVVAMDGNKVVCLLVESLNAYNAKQIAKRILKTETHTAPDILAVFMFHHVNLI